LNKNRSLKSLRLNSNQLSATPIALIAGALKSNKSLTELSLYDNELGDIGAEVFANLLKSNKTLLTVDLGKNVLGVSGARHLSSALGGCSLTRLSLATNEMGQNGCNAIADSLRNNTTIQMIDLRNNFMGHYKSLLRLLEINHSLLSLLVSGNQFTTKHQQKIQHLIAFNRDRYRLRPSMIAFCMGMNRRLGKQSPCLMLSNSPIASPIIMQTIFNYLSIVDLYQQPEIDKDKEKKTFKDKERRGSDKNKEKKKK